MKPKNSFIAALFLSLVISSPSFARIQDDGTDPVTDALQKVGKEIGSDRPELRDDARDFRNFTGIVGSAVEEFAGVSTKKYFGYLDLFLSLFKKKKIDQDSRAENPQDPDQPFEDIDSSENDESIIDPIDVAGPAGIINPVAAKSAAKSASFEGSGGGAFGINTGILRQRLGASEFLKLQQSQLEAQLGEEGQLMIAQKAKESADAMEGSNIVANEINEVTATQDAIKLGAKQQALQAVLSQLQFSEQQQTRLAQLQGNQTAFRVQEMMEADGWRRDVNRAVNHSASFRAASVFASMYGVKEE